MQNLSNQLTTLEISTIITSQNSVNEKISLRNLSSLDVDYFYTWAGDPEVAKTMTWEAYTSISEAEKFLNEIVVKHPWFKAICLDGKPVGSMTLTQGKGNLSCKAELGYVIAKDYWNKGIATAAVKQALKTGFIDLGIQRIEALVDPNNYASQKVLVKAGMEREGLLKKYMLFKGVLSDRYIYSITKE
jgi:RimJ/RimL family protein N-acetyltransferase